MSITGLSASYYTLQRTTPYVLDSVTAASGGHSATRQPSVPSNIQVRAEAAGSVVVAGTVNGSSDSETVTFTAAGYKTTAKRFSALTTFTPSGALLGTAIHAQAKGADGGANPKLKSNVATGIPGAFSPGAPRWAGNREARLEERQAMIAVDHREDITPKRGDYLVDEDTSERWFIEGVNLFRGGGVPRHWEIHVSLRDGEAPD